MAKTFTHMVEDHGPNSIVYETEPGQRAMLTHENGVSVIYVNRRACVFFAKLFAQLAEGNLAPGFHVHLGQDLDPEATEAVRVVLYEGFE